MTLEKITYDKMYPYRLKDSWGGMVCLTKEDLEELLKKLPKILDK